MSRYKEIIEDYLNPLQQSRKIAALVEKSEELVAENQKLRRG